MSVSPSLPVPITWSLWLRIWCGQSPGAGGCCVPRWTWQCSGALPAPHQHPLAQPLLGTHPGFLEQPLLPFAFSIQLIQPLPVSSHMQPSCNAPRANARLLGVPQHQGLVPWPPSGTSTHCHQLGSDGARKLQKSAVLPPSAERQGLNPHALGRAGFRDNSPPLHSFKTKLRFLFPLSSRVFPAKEEGLNHHQTPCTHLREKHPRGFKSYGLVGGKSPGSSLIPLLHFFVFVELCFPWLSWSSPAATRRDNLVSGNSPSCPPANI